MPQYSVDKFLVQGDFEPQCVETRWYAAYTRSRHEKLVSQQLQSKSVECFLPVYSTLRRWKDRTTSVELPLFPGYVFVHIDLRDRLRVLQLPGVVRLIGQDNRAEALPDAEIEALRFALTQEIPLEPHPFLKAGETVRITKGPFEGLEGVLLRKNRLRVVVSLDLINSAFVLDVDAVDVQPVGAWAFNAPPRASQSESPTYRNLQTSYL